MWYFRKIEELVRNLNLLSFPFSLRRRMKQTFKWALFIRGSEVYQRMEDNSENPQLLYYLCSYFCGHTHPHNYYGAINTLRWSFPNIVWVRNGLAQHMVGCSAKPLCWGIVFSILTAFSVSGVLGQVVHNWCLEPKLYSNKNSTILVRWIF